MDANSRITKYPISKVFEIPFPLPWDGFNVVTSDANNKPTRMDFYQNSNITGGVCVGTRVMQSDMVWDLTTKKIKSFTIKIIET